MFNVNLLGERIREVRGKKSQDVFATELGISRGALSFYENGERKPDAEIVYKICEFCNVSADYLLGLTDNPTTDPDLKAVCDYTGLSEEAVRELNFAFDSLSQPEALDLEESEYVTELLKTLSWLISERHIYEIIYHLLLVKDYSENYLIGCKHIRSNELYDLLNLSDLQEREKDIDFERYKLNKYIEKLSNYFDQREQVQDNGEYNPPKE